jgi:hypothetical protein
MPDINNFKEERFILFHCFRGFSPWFLGPMLFGRPSWWQEHEEERKKGATSKRPCRKVCKFVSKGHRKSPKEDFE